MARPDRATDPVLAFMIFFVGHALGGWMPEMLHRSLVNSWSSMVNRWWDHSWGDRIAHYSEPSQSSQTTSSSYLDVRCDGPSGLGINGFVANSPNLCCCSHWHRPSFKCSNGHASIDVESISS